MEIGVYFYTNIPMNNNRKTEILKRQFQHERAFNTRTQNNQLLFLPRQ